ncbi:hypothetical protein [Rhodococcus sp. T2V]|nr:hypothetical protein [Rhodococcus sp. T2V]
MYLSAIGVSVPATTTSRLVNPDRLAAAGTAFDRRDIEGAR